MKCAVTQTASYTALDDKVQNEPRQIGAAHQSVTFVSFPTFVVRKQLFSSKKPDKSVNIKIRDGSRGNSRCKTLHDTFPTIMTVSTYSVLVLLDTLPENQLHHIDFVT